MQQDPLGGILDRLDELQRGVARLEPKKSWLERHAFLVAPAATLLVFVLGFLFKDWADLTLRERQFNLSSAQAVQNHMQALAGSETEDHRLVAMAVALAEFGDVAVAPLVRHLRIDHDRSRRAAMEGLRTLALSARERTCDELGHVIARDRRDYPIWSHQSAVTLLADLRCPDAAAKLTHYEEAYLRTLQPEGRVTMPEIHDLRRTVQAMIKRLEEGDQ